MPSIHPRDMTDEEREAWHAASEAQIQTFRYRKPEPSGRPKQNTWLVRRPLMHYHTSSETTWFVLKGRAVFEGPEGVVLGELGPMEGILMPGGSRYKFRKEGNEDLEILQMVAIETKNGEAERINVEAHREWMASSSHLTKY
jgi:mannose-6-phosphate isomerase-like protein (cupin superfamily)